MAKPSILISSLISLGLLGASSASAAAYSNITQSNVNYQDHQKAREEGRITCVPQGDPQQQLWTCSDAYGNQFDNLIISKEKHGNSKRTGK